MSEAQAPRVIVDLLIFHLGAQRYALPAADVLSIMRAVALVPLPSAPPIVEGIVNVRGRVVPVVDIRKRFDLPSSPLDVEDHFILASAGATLVIVRADGVTELVQVPRSDIEDASGILSCSEHVAGVVKLPDGLVLIHDLKTFLSRGEAAALSAALEAAS